jgi:hypothetical protein
MSHTIGAVTALECTCKSSALHVQATAWRVLVLETAVMRLCAVVLR